MNLNSIWKNYIEIVLSEDIILRAEKKVVAGIPFLYINVKEETDLEMLEQVLINHAMKCMKGKRLNFEIEFVRQEDKMFVFRARFLVPQEKMFCCGNLCENCIRFK
ncbi:hypothetical protein CIB95_02630 [Lottiidibacillus patelloidae]|uniref:Uncharacterized protein n=1 Tax=Lottiidibacillus patelloidae TaxID=2670334 RepID=A0A263BY27_9BACI|nr:hypothetical protein [Lottiidibacillus patelloidae]OZM58482.1 hypothetical protein CIB95_02630 [Lottiidibacillus patelloidae]